jgi:hypothetical protein
MPTKLYIIDQNAQFASLKEKKINRLSLDGKQQVTRKNLLVIVVVLDHVMPVSCWYIMQMAINTIPIYAI